MYKWFQHFLCRSSKHSRNHGHFPAWSRRFRQKPCADENLNQNPPKLQNCGFSRLQSASVFSTLAPCCTSRAVGALWLPHMETTRRKCQQLHTPLLYFVVYQHTLEVTYFGKGWRAKHCLPSSVQLCEATSEASSSAWPGGHLAKLSLHWMPDTSKIHQGTLPYLSDYESQVLAESLTRGFKKCDPKTLSGFETDSEPFVFNASGRLDGTTLL